MTIWRRLLTTYSSQGYPKIDVKQLVLSCKVGTIYPPTQIKHSNANTTKVKSVAKKQKNKDPPSIKLHEQYNPQYSKIPIAEILKINNFFTSSLVKYEWSAADFLDIPGEKLRKEVKELKMLVDDISDYVSPSGYPKNTKGIPYDLLNGLPEVAFLGRCNAGKSTLLNNLTTDFQRVKLNTYAKSSKRAGFTKTVNCFNIGNKLRLIDTPGYGKKGDVNQGLVTMEYLKERKELKRTYLLISAEQGFSPYDAQMVDFLTKYGIPFEVIFTKMDKVKDADFVRNVIENSGVLNLPLLPQLVFLNSITNSLNPKRHGIGYLRYLIFQACNLTPGIKPSKSFRLKAHS
ncbi:HCL375Wp [Eremothecium sinecaudum]|uniref:HCL375Wp n=1 Tax=Eremothecium sinecaudum TaxID=45286 RepID=A0A109UWD1_9SACH|nr:HCL375Wp [Eremothecium sinecaudum]AMD19776.1 HCL375Wp [Eremothecium sinecaudum]